MNKRSVLASALVSVMVLGLLMTGCNPVGEFRDLVDGGTDALSKEDVAYRQLKSTAPKRGEAQIAALSAWVGTLSNLKTVMATANDKLRGKKVAKIRASSEVQSALARFKTGIDEVLGRNYAEASLMMVPAWRMQEAQQIAITAPNLLKQISSYYDVVFATANPQAGKSYSIAVQEDTQLLDTVQPCIDRVEAMAKGQAKSSYCVSAARAACGHQIDLSCVQNGMKSSLVNNTCPDVKTVTYKIDANETFRPESHINSSTEEVKDWKYGATVSQPNPDRNVATFCPSQYSEQEKAVLSTTSCYSSREKVRIYGYDEDRHVTIEIEGVKHANDPRKDVIVDLYAEGRFVGTQVIRPDYGWNNNVYKFSITQAAFQMNSLVKMQFRDMINVDTTDATSGQVKHKTAHWIVEAQIKGQDIPFLKKKEVHLTKYTPNTWVGGIVNSCVSATPVLK